ncbi:MAG: DUF4301 family protein, partial [Candidatus Tectomicrobia bacterium]|nr:DUF4301 family protein [Candidatus Tectomicrobia bacterium]
MEQVIFHDRDKAQIAAQGTTEGTVRAQIDAFRRGFPFANLQRPCTVGDGITIIAPQDITRLTDLYTQTAWAGRIQKLVPAAGAASRMFQSLLAVSSRYDRIELSQMPTTAAEQDGDYEAFLCFAKDLKNFAFYDALRDALKQQDLHLDTLIDRGQFKPVLDAMLTAGGLNYANLPKGLLPFHRYADHCRTPLEEHLVEAATLVSDQSQVARLHFAVSPQHLDVMSDFVQRVQPRYEQSGTRYEITWSTQKSSTDTIAVTPDNQPFRDSNGDLLFRPAGHGALLENLHELQGDLIAIKNIDNVVPDYRKESTYLSTQLLGGYLIDLQQQAFAHLELLAAKQADDSQLQQIGAFAQDKLSVALPSHFAQRPRDAQAEILFSALHRPLRVCGVVPNTGEPGGGPFWVEQENGRVSAQIVETSQVETSSEEQRAILSSSTHFNPVHLFCGVRDYRGQPFDLRQFVD